MATVVADSLKNYGIDEDGASVHDVIGTYTTLQSSVHDTSNYQFYVDFFLSWTKTTISFLLSLDLAW